MVQATRRTYDEASNILSAETFEYGKPKNGRTGEVLIPAGDRREYAYDKAGRLIKAKGRGKGDTERI